MGRLSMNNLWRRMGVGEDGEDNHRLYLRNLRNVPLVFGDFFLFLPGPHKINVLWKLGTKLSDFCYFGLLLLDNIRVWFVTKMVLKIDKNDNLFSPT